MKGKIIEVSKRSITLMTDDMKFVKVKGKESAELGSEIFYFEEDLLVSSVSNNTMKFLSAAVIMIAMFIGVSTFNVQNEPLISTVSFESEVVAVVSLDINPSVEIELDKNLRVVNAIARNNDGNAILDMQLIKGKYITIAIKDMLKLAKDSLFINDRSNTVLITTAPTDSINVKSSKELEKQMKNLAMESSDEEIEYVVASAPMSTLLEAREKEVSLGKLNVYDNIEENSKEISLVDIESKKVIDIKDEGYLEDTNYETFMPAKKINKIEVYRYIIEEGVEYGNVASFEKLGIKVGLSPNEKKILARYSGKDDFKMNYKYGVLIKDEEYYYNLKEVLDAFGFSFAYEGSKFLLDKDGENLVLDYVGEGIKSFKELTEIEDTAVTIDDKEKTDVTNADNKETLKETAIMESTIKETTVNKIEEDSKVTEDIATTNTNKEELIEEFKRDTTFVKGSKYDLIIDNGTEWISERLFIELGFEFEFKDKIYIRYDVISYEVDPSIIGLLEDESYYEAKSMLDMLGLEYGYTDDGFYFKTEKEFKLITDTYEGDIKFESYK